MSTSESEKQSPYSKQGKKLAKIQKAIDKRDLGVSYKVWYLKIADPGWMFEAKGVQTQKIGNNASEAIKFIEAGSLDFVKAFNEDFVVDCPVCKKDANLQTIPKSGHVFVGHKCFGNAIVMIQMHEIATDKNMNKAWNKWAQGDWDEIG